MKSGDRIAVTALLAGAGMVSCQAIFDLSGYGPDGTTASSSSSTSTSTATSSGSSSSSSSVSSSATTGSGTGGSSSSTGTGGTMMMGSGGAGGVGGTMMSGGGGGMDPGPICGDGKLDPVEECDTQAAWCVNCKVDCGMGTFTLPVTDDPKARAHCYWFSSSDTWSTVQGFCRAQVFGQVSWDMAAVGNAIENANITNYLFANGPMTVWIGLSTPQVPPNPLKWSWSNGDAVNMNALFWASGEPDSLNNEDCVAMALPGSADPANWHTRGCPIKYAALCESIFP